jgi:hypothetical protein
VSPDGQRFLMIEDVAGESRFIVVHGWERLLENRTLRQQ